MLKRRKLGNTGLEVSRLGLGGLFISSGVAERRQSCEVIRRAWELGINYIDTAPSYYDSEEVIGEALSNFDSDFIVSTKMGDLPAKDSSAAQRIRWKRRSTNVHHSARSMRSKCVCGAWGLRCREMGLCQLRVFIQMEAH